MVIDTTHQQPVSRLKGMMMKTDICTEFAQWLLDNVNDDCRENLARGDRRAIDSWLNSVSDEVGEGHIEIGQYFSHSGNPVTNNFPGVASMIPDGGWPAMFKRLA